VYVPGSPDGNARFFAPPHTPIVAARAGQVWSVEQTAKGWGIVISHGKPWATFYQHLETPGFEPHQRGLNTRTKQPTFVRRGQAIGFMGYSPEDAERLRHLHFEVWHGGDARYAVDPADAMAKWPLVPGVFTP
jgi:murein DD-endopeptidase MepM/ murein hydrolase activator NlpD